MIARLPRPTPLGLARGIAAVVVVLIALQVRLLAVDRLPIDFDEDDYLRAGQQYADGLRDGDPGILFSENYRSEHPPLTKLVTGLALLPLPEVAEIPDRPTTAEPAQALPEPHLTVARIVQAVEGAVGVGALAVISPLAAFFLAIHTWSIKYTSQVMLEALPAALSMIAAMAYLRSGVRATGATSSDRAARRGRRLAWLAVSAVAFGLACASKYPYGIVGLAILGDWAWSTRPWLETGGERAGAPPTSRASRVAGWLRPPVVWIALAIVAFFLADPYLWPDPIGRLGSSLTYHLGYAGSEAVAETGWPSWQALVWLSGSVPFHDPGTFVVSLDVLITVLAVIGSRRLWARQRVLAVWLALGLVFLLVWPTKWPQYLLLISAPLAAAAAHGAWIAVLEPVRARLLGWWRGRGAREARGSDVGDRGPTGRLRREGRGLGRALPWLAPGLLAVAVLVILPLLFETAMALTDVQRSSLRDGINGGVLREAVGGLTGSIPAQSFDLNASPREVHYVGLDLLSAFSGGVWLGGNTSAMFPAFSFLWMILSVGLQTAVGIAVAILLERPGLRFVLFWRTLFILPWAIPEFAGAIAWRTIVDPGSGWIALLTGARFDWPDSPDASLLILLVVATWVGWPLMMLVAVAGLRTIPRAVSDAARLEGAGALSRFRRVTLPLLLPLLAPALVIRAVAAFNQFYLFYVLRPPDPTITTATFSYYVFDSQAGPGLFAVSSAVNVLTLVALGAVVIWFMRWRERAERVAYW
jgi:ABC-type sugar transport system permease subunit